MALGLCPSPYASVTKIKKPQDSQLTPRLVPNFFGVGCPSKLRIRYPLSGLGFWVPIHYEDGILLFLQVPSTCQVRYPLQEFLTNTTFLVHTFLPIHVKGMVPPPWIRFLGFCFCGYFLFVRLSTPLLWVFCGFWGFSCFCRYLLMSSCCCIMLTPCHHAVV